MVKLSGRSYELMIDVLTEGSRDTLMMDELLDGVMYGQMDEQTNRCIN